MNEALTHPILTNPLSFLILVILYSLVIFIATAVIIDLVKQNKEDGEDYQGDDDSGANKKDQYNPFDSWNDPFDSWKNNLY